VKSRVHAIAGFLGLTLITLFFISSVTAEVFGDERTVARVKTGIAFALLLLLPSMAIAADTGRSLAKDWHRARRVQRKQRRMAMAALIGLTVLGPCAVTLASLAANGDFGSTFVVIQTVELVGDAVNIVLLGLNARDGRQFSQGRRRSRPAAPSAAGSSSPPPPPAASSPSQ
jgi:hypothetical protein